MMPSDWKLAYLKTADPITDPTFTCLDMARYMHIHESPAAAISHQQAQRQHQGNCGGRSNTGGNNCSGNVHGRRRGRGNQGGGDGGHNVRRCGNDGGMMCPFPGHNHPWVQCFANPHGTNYHPNYNPLGGRVNHQGNRGNAHGDCSRGDANLVETDMDEVPSPGMMATSEETLPEDIEDAQVNDEPMEDDHWLDSLQGNY